MANLIAINAIKDKKIPNDDLINQFIKEFKDKESQNEKVVQLAFDTYDNSTLEGILIKVILLNQIYSAGLADNQLSDEKRKEFDIKDKKYTVDVRTMAEHIKGLAEEFEKCKTDEDIIGLVGKVRAINKYKDSYSFATKYVAWSFSKSELNAPIVDSYVKAVLYWFNVAYSFCDFDFTKTSLEDYKQFCKVFNAFKDKYGQRKSSKEMDMFLWAYAKYYLLGDRGVKFG